METDKGVKLSIFKSINIIFYKHLARTDSFEPLTDSYNSCELLTGSYNSCELLSDSYNSFELLTESYTAK